MPSATSTVSSPYDGLTKVAFDAVGWPSLIAGVAVKECSEFTKPFAETAKTLEAAKQIDPARAAWVLTDIASFAFRPNESDRPFHPMIVWEGKRSPIPEDFPKELVSVIASLVPEAGDAEFSARLGDVVLIRTPKRDAKLVEATIKAYLASGENLFQQSKWDSGYLRFRRALQLIRKPSPDLANTIESTLETFLQNTAPKAPLLEVVQILELCRDYNLGEAAVLAGHAAAYAKQATEDKSWHLSRRLFTLNAIWLQTQKRETETKSALYEAAECFVKLAEEAMQRPTPSPMVAANHLMRAVKAHRDVEKSSQRAAEIDQLRVQYQQQGRQQTQWVNLSDEPGSEGLRNAIEVAEQHLQLAALDAARAAQGLPIYDALQLLVLCHPPPNKAKMEAMAVEELKGSVWSALIPIALCDEEGRTFAKVGLFLHSNPDGQQLVIEQRMLQWFKTYHVTETVAIFEAIREQITEEHNVMPEHVEPIVAHSPFIPQGMGYLFARGLYAGMIGDFPLAACLLAPQLENAIRVCLQAHGVIPTVTEKSETERPADLNYLFRNKRKEIEAVFGVDVAFELEALLIRRWGCHLRNYIAHGQLSLWQYMEPPVRYLWWITLRFCMFGAAPIPRPKAQS